MNPVEWYQDVRSWVAQEDEPPPATASSVVPQPRQELLDAPYPNLASVPERPRPTMDPGATDRAFRALEADREEAQRLDRAIRRDGPPAPSPDAALRPESPIPGIAAPDDRTRDVYRRQLAASASPPSQPAPSSGSDAAVPAPASASASPVSAPAVPAPPAAGPPALVASIGFADGSAVVDANGRSVLAQVVEAYRARPGSKLQLVGHASSKTRDMPLEQHKLVNFEMSLRRANAVMVALIGMGIPQDAMQVSALADGDPVYYETMPAGEAENRRVEIYIVY